MEHFNGLLQKYRNKLAVSRLIENNKRAQNRTGRASEFMVASDLMRQGFDVYFAVSATNEFDLIARKNNKLSTVEVKTTRDLKAYPTMVRKNPDILALVNYENGIKYLYRTIAKAEGR